MRPTLLVVVLVGCSSETSAPTGAADVGADAARDTAVADTAAPPPDTAVSDADTTPIDATPDPDACGDPPYSKVVGTVAERAPDFVRKEGVTVTSTHCPGKSRVTSSIGGFEWRITHGAPMSLRFAGPDDIVTISAERAFTIGSGISFEIIAKSAAPAVYSEAAPLVRVGYFATGTKAECKSGSGTTITVVGHPEAKISTTSPTYITGLAAGTYELSASKPGCTAAFKAGQFTGRVLLEDGAITLAEVRISD